uniref:Uncharacterized protein n=1 Tax=Magallana gigas TaxID=29159 RepID=A0A8W8K605_MAGGI
MEGQKSSQVDTNQSSTSNVKADVISDDGSETDEIDNDVNLGARRKNLELEDSLNGCKVISSDEVEKGQGSQQFDNLKGTKSSEDSLSRDNHEEESSDEEEWLSQEPDFTTGEESGISHEEPSECTANNGSYTLRESRRPNC